MESGAGPTREAVRRISEARREPAWMADLRASALEVFERLPSPVPLDLARVRYLEPERAAEEISEKNAGGRAQFESEAVYKSLRADWARQGVIFQDTDSALRERPDLLREHWGRVVPPEDGKLAALNAAVWSGGAFVYVPKGVRVEVPLQAYFRINAQNEGRFERTLIIVDEGAEVHYVEGCTAPTYSEDALHASVIEIVVRRGGRCQYTTLQNWSRNVFNFVSKRAIVEDGASVRWVDANIGSKITVKHPSARLVGRGARAEVLAVAFASEGQHQDVGADIVHEAPETVSSIEARAVARRGGRASFRGRVRVAPEARGAEVRSRSRSLVLEAGGACDAGPLLDVETDDARLEHEASVVRLSAEELFYLESRGIETADAKVMIVNGFIQPIVKELPMEYAVELARLVQGELEGASCR